MQRHQRHSQAQQNGFISEPVFGGGQPQQQPYGADPFAPSGGYSDPFQQNFPAPEQQRQHQQNGSYGYQSQSYEHTQSPPRPSLGYGTTNASGDTSSLFGSNAQTGLANGRDPFAAPVQYGQPPSVAHPSSSTGAAFKSRAGSLVPSYNDPVNNATTATASFFDEFGVADAAQPSPGNTRSKKIMDVFDFGAAAKPLQAPKASVAAKPAPGAIPPRAPPVANSQSSGHRGPSHEQPTATQIKASPQPPGGRRISNSSSSSHHVYPPPPMTDVFENAVNTKQTESWNHSGSMPASRAASRKPSAVAIADTGRGQEPNANLSVNLSKGTSQNFSRAASASEFGMGGVQNPASAWQTTNASHNASRKPSAVDVFPTSEQRPTAHIEQNTEEARQESDENTGFAGFGQQAISVEPFGWGDNTAGGNASSDAAIHSGNTHYGGDDFGLASGGGQQAAPFAVEMPPVDPHPSTTLRREQPAAVSDSFGAPPPIEMHSSTTQSEQQPAAFKDPSGAPPSDSFTKQSQEHPPASNDPFGAPPPVGRAPSARAFGNTASSGDHTSVQPPFTQTASTTNLTTEQLHPAEPPKAPTSVQSTPAPSALPPPPKSGNSTATPQPTVAVPLPPSSLAKPVDVPTQETEGEAAPPVGAPEPTPTSKAHNISPPSAKPKNPVAQKAKPVTRGLDNEKLNAMKLWDWAQKPTKSGSGQQASTAGSVSPAAPPSVGSSTQEHHGVKEATASSSAPSSTVPLQSQAPPTNTTNFAVDDVFKAEQSPRSQPEDLGDPRAEFEANTTQTTQPAADFNEFNSGENVSSHHQVDQGLFDTASEPAPTESTLAPPQSSYDAFVSQPLHGDALGYGQYNFAGTGIADVQSGSGEETSDSTWDTLGDFAATGFAGYGNNNDFGSTPLVDSSSVEQQTTAHEETQPPTDQYQQEQPYTNYAGAGDGEKIGAPHDPFDFSGATQADEPAKTADSLFGNGEWNHVTDFGNVHPETKVSQDDLPLNTFAAPPAASTELFAAVPQPSSELPQEANFVSPDFAGFGQPSSDPFAFAGTQSAFDARNPVSEQAQQPQAELSQIGDTIMDHSFGGYDQSFGGFGHSYDQSYDQSQQYPAEGRNTSGDNTAALYGNDHYGEGGFASQDQAAPQDASAHDSFAFTQNAQRYEYDRQGYEQQPTEQQPTEPSQSPVQQQQPDAAFLADAAGQSSTAQNIYDYSYTGYEQYPSYDNQSVNAPPTFSTPAPTQDGGPPQDNAFPAAEQTNNYASDAYYGTGYGDAGATGHFESQAAVVDPNGSFAAADYSQGYDANHSAYGANDGTPQYDASQAQYGAGDGTHQYDRATYNAEGAFAAGQDYAYGNDQYGQQYPPPQDATATSTPPPTSKADDQLNAGNNTYPELKPATSNTSVNALPSHPMSPEFDGRSSVSVNSSASNVLEYIACPKCSKRNDSECNFCGKCGTNLSGLPVVNARNAAGPGAVSLDSFSQAFRQYGAPTEVPGRVSSTGPRMSTPAIVDRNNVAGVALAPPPMNTSPGGVLTPNIRGGPKRSRTPGYHPASAPLETSPTTLAYQATDASAAYPQQPFQLSQQQMGRASPVPAYPVQQAAPAEPAGFEDPLGRHRGHCVAVFGPNGKLFTTFPQRQTRYVTDAYGRPSVVQKTYPGTVSITPMSQVVNPAVIEGYKSHPGPLIGGKSKVKKKDVVKFVEEMVNVVTTEKRFLQDAASVKARDSGFITEDEQNAVSEKEDEELTLSLLKLIVENDGPVVSPISNPAGDASVKKVMQLLSPADNATALQNGRHVDQILGALLSSDKDAAVNAAVAGGLWSHALLIASNVSKDKYRDVVTQFLRNEFTDAASATSRTGNLGGAGEKSESAALRFLYGLFGGLAPQVIDDFLPVFDGTRPAASVATLDKWREVVCLILANRTPGDLNVVAALGDRLKAQNRNSAAEFCYLLASIPGMFNGIDAPNGRVVLLGSDHIKNPSAFFLSSTALRKTEILEFAQTQHNSAGISNSMPHLQAYKVQFASVLADIGLVDQATKYCDGIESVVKQYAKGSPYFHRTFGLALGTLSARLAAAKEGPGALSGAAAAGKEGSSWLSKLGSLGARGVEKLMNNALGEADVRPSSPSNSLLTPAAVADGRFTPGPSSAPIQGSPLAGNAGPGFERPGSTPLLNDTASFSQLAQAPQFQSAGSPNRFAAATSQTGASYGQSYQASDDLGYASQNAYSTAETTTYPAYDQNTTFGADQAQYAADPSGQQYADGNQYGDYGASGQETQGQYDQQQYQQYGEAPQQPGQDQLQSWDGAYGQTGYEQQLPEGQQYDPNSYQNGYGPAEGGEAHSQQANANAYGEGGFEGNQQGYGDQAYGQYGADQDQNPNASGFADYGEGQNQAQYGYEGGDAQDPNIQQAYGDYGYGYPTADQQQYGAVEGTESYGDQQANNYGTGFGADPQYAQQQGGFDSYGQQQQADAGAHDYGTDETAALQDPAPQPPPPAWGQSYYDSVNAPPPDAEGDSSYADEKVGSQAAVTGPSEEDDLGLGNKTRGKGKKADAAGPPPTAGKGKAAAMPDSGNKDDKKSDDGKDKSKDDKDAKDKDSKAPQKGLFSAFGSLFGGRKRGSSSDDISAGAKDAAGGPVKANLGEKSAFYYDEKKKKWVNKNNAADDDDEPELKPPPIGMPSPALPRTSTPGAGPPSSSSQISPTDSGAPSPALDGAPFSGSGGKRRGARNKYVDIFNPDSGKNSPSTSMSFIPPAGITGTPKILKPATMNRNTTFSHFGQPAPGGVVASDPNNKPIPASALATAGKEGPQQARGARPPPQPTQPVRANTTAVPASHFQRPPALPQSRPIPPQAQGRSLVSGPGVNRPTAQPRRTSETGPDRRYGALSPKASHMSMAGQAGAGAVQKQGAPPADF
ncbi:uncharacterized protein EV422DRAFT_579147 [Fimicolochytrium jonesii]|uniref:uncharacterized protein n=1 Tax=Fimicolochytrium jonesii TaxID=1396493 RepID=UPI0022FDCEF5|nr:uncharacterized protein EV422DRAFT_579147 [Fimicolochytrium jonesii]KAI8819959.1 hypothetical protein EV422DRAFT_579147 [Fimicolochytrium jonesii]